MILRSNVSKSIALVLWLVVFTVNALAQTSLINTGLQPGGVKPTIQCEPFQRFRAGQPLKRLSGVQMFAITRLKPGVNESASRPKSYPKSAQQQSLENRVRTEAAQFKGKVSLFAKNLDTGATFSFHGDEPVQTASTIKIAVMIEAFARVTDGKAKWTDELVLTKEKKVGGSGILFEFSDGLRLTLRDATTLMMVLSDNTATNLVIDTFGADAVNARMESLGLKGTRLMRRVFGGGDSAEGKKPQSKRFGLGRTTAREMVTLVEKLEPIEIARCFIAMLYLAMKNKIKLDYPEEDSDDIKMTLVQL